MFRRIKSIRNKRYIIGVILLSILLYAGHYFRWQYDPIVLLNAGYVEGVVLDNATRPDCDWDNKVYGEGNSCDRHGSFDILKDDGTYATVHIWQMDYTRSYINFYTIYQQPCYGRIIGFPEKERDPSLPPVDPSNQFSRLQEQLRVKHEVHPGDRIRVFGEKSTYWVTPDKNGELGVVDKKTKDAYQYSHYRTCDSSFFFAEKIQ